MKVRKSYNPFADVGVVSDGHFEWSDSCLNYVRQLFLLLNWTLDFFRHHILTSKRRWVLKNNVEQLCINLNTKIIENGVFVFKKCHFAFHEMNNIVSNTQTIPYICNENYYFLNPSSSTHSPVPSVPVHEKKNKTEGRKHQEKHDKCIKNVSILASLEVMLFLFLKFFLAISFYIATLEMKQNFVRWRLAGVKVQWYYFWFPKLHGINPGSKKCNTTHDMN